MSEILNGNYPNLTEKTLREIIEILGMPPADERHLLDLYRGYDPFSDLSLKVIDDIAQGEEFRNLLAQLEPLPAMVCNQRMDILTWNSVARVMLVDFDLLKQKAPAELNIMRQMFCNPQMRERFLDWDRAVSELMRSFQRQMSRHTDPESVNAFNELSRDLRARSAKFAELEDEQEVRLDPLRMKQYKHPNPTVGTLLMDQWVLEFLGFDGRLVLLIFVPQAGSTSAEGFRHLASLARASQ